MQGGCSQILREVFEETVLQAIGTHTHKLRWDADTQGAIGLCAGGGYLLLGLSMGCFREA